MAETSIAWTDYTFNPWWGCQRVSPGCEHCYAEAWDKRVGGQHWGPTTERRFFGDKHWNEPLRWNRHAERSERDGRVFCASMADVFEDRRDLDDQRARLWDLIRATPNLTWQLLTKRPENIGKLSPGEWVLRGWPSNVWLGTTTEDQQRADERLPILLAQRAVVHFASYEPALGPVDFSRWLPVETIGGVEMETWLSWVIAGGESGPKHRPPQVEWFLAAQQQCAAAGVAFFMKQGGASWFHTSEFGQRNHVLPDLDAKGGDLSEMPEALRVREFPTVQS